MGLVVVISVPLILLVAILALACYLLGRSKGRTEATPMYYGPPAPPMAAGPPPKYLPNQAEVKKEWLVEFAGSSPSPSGRELRECIYRIPCLGMQGKSSALYIRKGTVIEALHYNVHSGGEDPPHLTQNDDLHGLSHKRRRPKEYRRASGRRAMHLGLLLLLDSFLHL
ncbi:hypothetical protein C4D60_Mb04t35620 [Musa balbisiana]|uniref:Uncharacterized protein n=1 Tax=Musa balbisiana TaxID=52838 RepID=A0A4S8KH69_MUSBA|nr:hypothetical protein C4D60_Mb04t35620 [Musa balbisiana]